MSQKVHTEFTSNPDQLLAAYKKIQAEQEKTIENLKQHRAHSEHTHNAVVEHLHEEFNSIKRGAAEYLTLKAALELVNVEYERKRELEKSAAEAQMTYFPRLQAFLRQQVNLTKEGREAIAHQAEGISIRTGFKQEEVLAAGSKVHHASPNLSPQQQLEMVDIAGRTAPSDVEAMQELAESIAGVGRITGRGAKESLGTLLSAGKVSGIDADEMRKLVAPRAVAGETFGASFEDTAGLIGALRSQTGGKQPLNTASKLAVDIEAAAQKVLGRRKDLTTFDERLDAIRADPRLQKKFLKEGNFEDTDLGAVKSLLDSGGDVSKEYARMRAGILHGKAAEDLAQAEIDRISKDPTGIANRAAETLKTSQQRQELENPSEALAGALSPEAVDKSLAIAGEGGLPWAVRRMRSSVRNFFGEDWADIQMDEIRGAIDQLRDVDPEFPEAGPRGTASREDLAKADELERTLSKMVALQQEALDFEKKRAEREEANARRSPLLIHDGHEN